MADTAIEITAGTGTQVDTRTEGTNGHHRQVIVIGDPATNAGVAPVDAAAGLTVNLGANNDVTLATLPDTASGDLAALVVDAAAIEALLTTIDTDTGAMVTDLAAIEVLLGTMDADTGAIVGHVDGIETLLGTIDADTSVLAGAVTLSKMQVEVASALPAGNNNIGDVDIASALPAGTNNIGDVDVLTVPADPFGANADAASATGSISAKLRGIATALGITALDLGSGTGGSRTLRFFKDTAQWIGGAGAVTSATMRATLASDDPAVAGLGGTADAAATAGSTGSLNAKMRLLTSQLANAPKVLDGDYETVAASQTDQMMGPTGAAGDYLAGVLIIPATVSPGLVSIEDGATNIVIFAGGTDSVLTLHPFYVPLGIISVSGGWEITTGANVSCICVGSFT